LPHLVIIDYALRDEGTTCHYAVSAEFSRADTLSVRAAASVLEPSRLRFVVGSSWTTDAPFREDC